MSAYPLGIALKGAGGRKAKQDRHIRSARQRRKAFFAEGEKLVRKFEATHGIHVDVASDYFWEMCERDSRFAALNKALYTLRESYFSY